MKVKKNKMTGSHPGLARWTGSRVDRVFPGQFPSGFLPQLGPVSGPGRPAEPVRVLKHWVKPNFSNVNKKFNIRDTFYV